MGNKANLKACPKGYKKDKNGKCVKRKLWDSMKDDIMTGNAKKSRYSAIEEQMRRSGM
jgi:hypothetical protein